MQLFSRLWSIRYLVNSGKIAIVVGTVLNLINQGSALAGRSELSWLHLILNYCVPFCVAYYSAWRNETGTESERSS